MPKTLLEKIVFTIIMAAIMVYGMIVYNVALNTGGVTNLSASLWKTSAPNLPNFAWQRRKALDGPKKRR